jgi:hypothetical protein
VPIMISYRLNACTTTLLGWLAGWLAGATGIRGGRAVTKEARVRSIKAFYQCCCYATLGSKVTQRELFQLKLHKLSTAD